MAYIMRFAADNVREVVITDSGHWLMEEQPKATVAAIEGFLSADRSIGPRTLGVAEIGALARGGAGVGTSGVGGIQTIVLSGDPAKAGPYAIELKIPAHTRIAAHTHRDSRLAMVVSGDWHFGYGGTADDAHASVLTQGAFYTEPANAPHFAFTGDQPAEVFITGTGPERYALYERKRRHIPSVTENYIVWGRFPSPARRAHAGTQSHFWDKSDRAS
jgi:quercetin dioxygenase-like cupin family protein